MAITLCEIDNWQIEQPLIRATAAGKINSLSLELAMPMKNGPAIDAHVTGGASSAVAEMLGRPPLLVPSHASDRSSAAGPLRLRVANKIDRPQTRMVATPGLDETAESTVTLQAAISRLPLPVLIVDGAGNLLIVNDPARRILDQRDGLRQSRQLLETSSPARTKRLRAMVRSALLTPMSSRRANGIAAVPRPSGRQPLVLVIRPLRACTTDCIAHCGRALIVIYELEWRHTESAGLLQQTFGLTPAETEVTTSLMEGRSLHEIADRRSVRLSTIRSQIKSVFAKTGVNRQIDLVRLVARLPDMGPT